VRQARQLNRATFRIPVSLEGMRVLRFLLAAVIVIAALFAGIFALAIVAICGLAALAVHALRRKRMSSATTADGAQRPRVYRERPGMTGDVIEIEATDAAGGDRPSADLPVNWPR
jgi:hypothetical protein